MLDLQSNKVTDALLTSVNKPKSEKSTAQAAEDKFITLLVSQMKNQDPLNPMDNAQVTSQLAQLSTVTGIDKLNVTMQSMINSVQAGQSYQAANLIGKTVLVKGNTFNLANNQGVFAVDLPSRVDDLKVDIKDSFGRLVKTMELGAQSGGSLPVAWNGFNEAGVKSADGLYKIEVTATAGGKSADYTALSYANVNSISGGPSGVSLNLDNKTSVATTDVREIL